jgi:RHS repeat-associated protein
VERHAYDAWGRKRNVNDWSDYNVENGKLDRGYTGHESLREFGLINMNGRMYDPVLGRMLSPDNYVQDPFDIQNYNRYTYCLNNPLKYTDPSGEFLHLIVGALIGGFINWAANGFQFSWEGLGHFAIGAAAGALSAGIGAGVNVAMAGGSFTAGFMGAAAGVSSTGFIAGAATGAAAGSTGGFITGFGNGLVGGDNFWESLGNGALQGLIGGAAGGAIGGLTGGIDALTKKTNFWTGKATFDLSKGYGACGSAIGEEPITGKYVGKFEGVNIYESEKLGVGRNSSGVTLPGRGIIVGKGVGTKGVYDELLQHEFGHILQAREVGIKAYYTVIAKESLISATFQGVGGWNHNTFWTETWANYLSSQYFGSRYIMSSEFPIQNISTFNYIRVTSPYLFP